MKRVLLAGVALGALALGALAMAPRAKAQWVVSDPPTELNTLSTWLNTITTNAHEVTEIENQATQITQLATTIAAIAHGNYYAFGSLVPELAQSGLIDPLGTDSASLVQAMGGLATATGGLAGAAGQFLATTQIYAPSGGDYRALQDISIATGLASQLAIGTQLGNANQQRMNLIPQIAQAAAGSPDIKDAMDANARLTGEAAEGIAQGNQIAAIRLMQETQKQVNEAHDEQMWRCSADQLVQDAQAAANAAAGGAVVAVSAPGTSLGCALGAATAGNSGAGLGGDPGSTASDGTGASVSAPGDDGGALATMEAQSWGAQAAQNAQAMGVNPSALAAICVLESNCQNASDGAGTVSGPFQMTDATYASDLNAATSQNPNLASQVTDKTDPATESIAAAQDLKTAAQSLQANGISSPSVLDVRAVYQWGAGAGPAVATADPNATMASVLPQYTTAQLAANGVSPGTTVGQWRQGITNKLGAAASQPALLGASA